ncbi:protease SohB [Paraneptunicella aestuarii]|uniref:protease SohB n=1 Tax=Paraneptunicella aestuarii TaxID=2831148 RepID=UPI001E5F922E|nr:protease SohB [Paraneptunicella aestuarii]UAA40755.1 protease SohB [Paraneptunicella aestuarii]
MEFLYDYGMFLLKAITIVAAILLAFGGLAGIASKQKHQKGELEIIPMSEQLAEAEELAKEMVFSKEEFKEWKKQQKELNKQKEKESDDKGKVYVIDFKGSMDAHEVESLRREVTTVITLATEKDEVVLRLESPGGVVSGYGLAASQLQRLKDRNIKLTACVDKVAASGGYMMACVADKILAAPFSAIGSIGVLAQIPNFHKLLKKNNIEFEQHTAGKYKRTITMFGENDDEGRAKFREELEEVHGMFKDFVHSHRENLDMEKIATGEYWHGIKAHELGLVDELKTSDDYLLECYKDKVIFQISYKMKKSVAEKLSKSASMTLNSVISKLWEKQNSGMWQ